MHNLHPRNQVVPPQRNAIASSSGTTPYYKSVSFQILLRLKAPHRSVVVPLPRDALLARVEESSYQLIPFLLAEPFHHNE